MLLHTVKREPLVVTVAEKGTLESADNRDLVCKVRAGSKGFASTINWVIDDGARVRPGQVLMRLDDSALKDQEEDQKIKVQAADANEVKAGLDLKIAKKQYEKDLATADSAFTTSVNALNNYVGVTYDPARAALAAVAGGPASLTESRTPETGAGTFRQSVDDLTGQVRLAESTVEQNRDRAAWADRMVKQSYLPAVQAQADKTRLESSVEDLRSKRAKLKQLIESDRDQTLTKLLLDREIARISRDQIDLTGEANVKKAEAELKRATDEYTQQKEKLDDIRKQRAECKVVAPDTIEPDSMVVYFKNESNRFGNNTQGMIEQGAQVKEGQKMLRIPNLRRMQVNTKVHEAMVARIRGDVREPTHIVDGVQKLMMFNTDHFSRLLGQTPDYMDEVRQQFRNSEYKKTAEGQKASIRVDAVSERAFEGHVRIVAAVASQADSWISDVKLYQTIVTIDNEVLPDGTRRRIANEELKPDMTAEVTITVDTAKEPVLTVPVQAVIGGAEMGAKREVFVKTPTGFDRREVKLGLYNEKVVEIREGLAEGDEVVLNPKVLLAPDDKTKTRDDGSKNGNKGGNGKSEGESPKGEGGPPGVGAPKGDGKTGPGGPGGGKGKKGGAGGGPPAN